MFPPKLPVTVSDRKYYLGVLRVTSLFMPRSKYWCFTLNNYSSDEFQALRSTFSDSEIVSYAIVGEEGRDATPHLQGYVEFVKRYSLRRAKSLLCVRVHLEPRNGTAAQAADYCRKEENFIEYGTISNPQQGHRSDLDDIKKSLDDGVPLGEIADNHFSQWVYHRRAFAEYQQLKLTSRSWVTEVYVYWGDTGTGKTRRVHELELESSLYVAPDCELNWFNGYSGHPAVLFDDFVGCKNVKFPVLLKLLDRYPMTVPTKGGFVNWIPKRIYLTSNINPDNWFFGVNPQQQAALRRRFTQVLHFSSLAN